MTIKLFNKSSTLVIINKRNSSELVFLYPGKSVDIQVVSKDDVSYYVDSYSRSGITIQETAEVKKSSELRKSSRKSTKVVDEVVEKNED